MRKIVCTPENLIPLELKPGIKYICTYSNSRREDVGYFGPSLKNDIIKKGLIVSSKIWDFTTIALSVAAADNSISRSKSPDGWTRQISLDIHLHDPEPWKNLKEHLQKILRFLTGDFWEINFLGGGSEPPQHKNIQAYDSDCISLLSGGVDSLVGAIDLVANGRKPLFVSQVVKGSSHSQREFAKRLGDEENHIQWSQKMHCPGGELEISTRGRSIVFFAFAAIASSAITSSGGFPVEIIVPENGFISINIPLNSGRIGSFSTKTTHPIYIKGIQDIFDSLGINIRLVLPYQFKTKGEMIIECKNQGLLKELIAESISCGKYSKHGHMHCGRCVPCMVRRSAFLKANMQDTTVKGYKFENLSQAGLMHGANDVGAMASACFKYRQYGIHTIIGGSLSFAQRSNRKDYEGVISRGFEEIEQLLIENGVI